MILEVTAKTKNPEMRIDFIELATRQGNIVVDWDTSGIDRNEDGFFARYKGVYFNEEYANGMLEDVTGAKISCVQLYLGDSNEADFQIETMTFYDQGHVYNLPIGEGYEIILAGD